MSLEPPRGDKFLMQDREYAFPYHHLARFVGHDSASIVRALRWGLEYLCYQRHVVERTIALRPQSVLDIGCGDGFLLGLLGPAISRRKGIDASERAILLARAMHPDVEFTVGDLGSLDGVFDVVLAIEILEHVSDAEVGGVLRQAARLLRPGGSLLVSVPTTNIPQSPKHHRHYDRALLERQVESSGAPLALASVEYVYRKSHLVDSWSALMNNRYWIVELYPLTRLMWRYVWSRLRHAGVSDGAHLFARFDRRPDDA